MPSSEQATTQCPWCGEDIRPAARKCKHCGSVVGQDVTPSHGGTCPYCREAIQPGAVKCKHCLAALEASVAPTHEGVCPKCREQIDANATRCKHCRSWLNAESLVGASCCHQAGTFGTAERRIVIGQGYDKGCMDTCVDDCRNNTGKSSEYCWERCLDKGGCTGGGRGDGGIAVTPPRDVLEAADTMMAAAALPARVRVRCPDGTVKDCPVVYHNGVPVYRCDLACGGSHSGLGPSVLTRW